VTDIRLTAPILDIIRRHGAATYPNECCGALVGTLGDDGVVDVLDALPLPNTTEEGPRRRFLVRGSDYRQAESSARERDADLLGFYHSHPDHPAQPSSYDLEHAWPNFSYVIVAVSHGSPQQIRSWRLSADRSTFHEENIETVEKVRS
jgi:proteasome lid subunit RPN8/RPN11